MTWKGVLLWWRLTFFSQRKYSFFCTGDLLNQCHRETEDFFKAETVLTQDSYFLTMCLHHSSLLQLQFQRKRLFFLFKTIPSTCAQSCFFFLSNVSTFSSFLFSVFVQSFFPVTAFILHLMCPGLPFFGRTTVSPLRVARPVSALPPYFLSRWKIPLFIQERHLPC